MLRNIILALFAFIVVALVVLWVLNGGPWRLYDKVRNFSISGTGTTTEGGFSLPWQPADIFNFVGEDVLFPGNQEGSKEQAEADLETLQREYAELTREANDVLTFGNPSPFFRTVRITGSFSQQKSSNPSEEYILIEAPYTNTSPVSLAGWSLQSAVSGTRIALPSAASPFVMGTVNTIEPVTLVAGASATIVSGPSPVGISFRENMCTGYLAQFQNFEPSLSRQCPSPYDEMPLTAENLQRYGEVCIDFAHRLPSCEFPQNVPSVSPACRAFLQTTFSYNGCVSRHSRDYGFSEDSWRVYLSSNTELWRNLHDAIRLLDAQGQTVDVYVY